MYDRRLPNDCPAARRRGWCSESRGSTRALRLPRPARTHPVADSLRSVATVKVQAPPGTRCTAPAAVTLWRDRIYDDRVSGSSRHATHHAMELR